VKQLRDGGITSDSQGDIYHRFFRPKGAGSSPVDAFVAALNQDTALAPVLNGWLQTPVMGRIIQPHMVAIGLLAAGVRGENVETLLQVAKDFAANKTSGITTYVALCGLKIDTEFKMDDQFSLVPIADVPEGEEKSAFIGAGDNGFPDFFRPKATAFLKYKRPAERLLFDNSDEVTSKGETPTADVMANEVVLCASALTGKPLSVLGSWSRLDGAAGTLMGGALGSCYSGALFEMEMASPSHNPVELNGTEFLALFSKWQSLKSPEKAALVVALGRMSQGLRRHNLVDRALDFGIALEVILLHGVGSNTELSFRFCIHAANFLGGTNDERYVNYKFWKSVYNLRSQAAHTGTLKDIGQHEIEILEKAGNFCAKIALMIIDRGGFPTWDKEFVLGGLATSEAR
jgi:Apea-like HEPN